MRLGLRIFLLQFFFLFVMFFKKLLNLFKNNRTTIGQMSDIRQSILNVKTPPGDRNVFYSAIQKEPASIRRDNSDLQRTYRKYIDSNKLTFDFSYKNNNFIIFYSSF